MKKFLDVMKIIFLKLHLWLPVAYSLLFLIVGAMTNSLEGSATFYFGGLSACLLVSLVLEFLTIGRQETSSGYRNVSAAQPPRVRYAPRDAEAPEKVQEEQNRYARNMTVGAPTSDVDYTRYDRSTYAPSQKNDADDILVHDENELMGKKAHDALYSNFSGATNVQSFSAYVQPENSLTSGPKMEDYEKSALPPEKPHVYRTHKNPNWLICEYSDRIEKWYVDPKTGDKSIISTEYKTK